MNLYKMQKINARTQKYVLLWHMQLWMRKTNFTQYL